MKRPPRLDLNPSSADRWTTCTASPHFILENHDRIPQSSDTAYNREGTTAHEVAAALLLGREPDPKECPVPITSEMWKHGWDYAEYVSSFIEPGSKLIVEEKMPLWYMPERNAKVDARLENPNALHIFDYKYGEGIAVSPEGNKQMVIYARTKADEFMDHHQVFLHIYQPRGRTAEEHGPAQVWETTWGEIVQRASAIQTAAVYVQEGRETADLLVFAPSDKACQWCPAKGFCEARQRSLAEGFEVIEAVKTLAPQAMDIERSILPILKYGKQMVKLINDVEEWAEQHLQNGGTIPGYKLVMSRGGNRYWSNPEEAKKLLLETCLRREEVVSESIISPAQAEKLLGKGKFVTELTNLIAKPGGKPTMVPEDDKREAIGVSAIAEFEVL